MRGVIAVGAVVVCLVLPTTAGAASYSNTTPLGPADNAPLPPYPSSILVSGEQGVTLKLTATLVGVAGAAVRDLDALLVGPSGRSILATDACSAGGIVPDWGGQTVTFDDAAGIAIPETCPVGGTPSGTYRPGDYDGADSFPGIPAPFPTSLAAFNGVSPNGIWSLYVVDDNAADALRISGGWRLDVTTTGAPAAPVVKKRKCKRKRRKGAASAKRKRCKKKRR